MKVVEEKRESYRFFKNKNYYFVILVPLGLVFLIIGFVSFNKTNHSGIISRNEVNDKNEECEEQKAPIEEETGKDTGEENDEGSMCLYDGKEYKNREMIIDESGFSCNCTEVGVICGSVLESNTKLEENLSTFQHPEYGFAFDYPSDWVMSDISGAIIKGNDNRPESASGLSFQLEKDGYRINFALNTYWDDVSGEKCDDHLVKVLLQNGTEAGRLGYTGFDEDSIIDYFWFYDFSTAKRFLYPLYAENVCTWEGGGIILSDDLRVIITYTSEDSLEYEEWKYLDEMDAIVSTLRVE